MRHGFQLPDFLPYLLNQAAEASSLGFNRYYKDTYGMLRTEWRVMFHLGHYGSMTASEVCGLALIHKTKVSRAVAALEAKRFLARTTRNDDRRQEILTLTRAGTATFTDLQAAAAAFDAEVAGDFTSDEVAVLRRCLRRIAGLDAR